MERFLDYFIPKNYQLNFEINKAAATLSGIATITGTAKTSRIKLHAVNLAINKITTKSQPNPKFTYDQNQTIILNVKPGPQTITIHYHTKLNTNMQGAYLSTYQYQGQEERIVATQFESHYARECFPCIDEPAAKATFELTIQSDDPTDLILSNTPVKKQRSAQQNSDTQSVSFTKTPRMSTYLLAFIVGKFHHRETTTKQGIKVTSYCALHQNPDTLDFANHTAARCLEYYHELFQTPYPLPKLDQVALPDFEAGAMENWGLVTYRESCLLADHTATAASKQFIALVIAHELAHQWFGNLVTMTWWDDLWLNEAFASVLEYYAIDSIYPEYQVWEDFFTGSCLAALKRDAHLHVQAVQQPVSHPSEISTLFDGAIVYAKGARLILMLIRLMGETAFFKGIKEYFVKHQYSNTTGDDLWAALQPHADFDVKELMHAWISQPGYPVITGTTQKRFLLSGQDETSPTSTISPTSTTSFTSTTLPTPTTPSKPTTWPIPTIKNDLSGHYLINLSDAKFKKTLHATADLSTEQRLRLLIDRMLLAQTDLVPSTSLIDLLEELTDESSAAIWEIMSSIITNLKVFFTPYSTPHRHFQAFIQQLIQPNLARLNITPAPTEPLKTTHLRNTLLSLAYYAEEQAALTELAQLYQPDPTKLHPEIRGFILLAKMYTDEATTFETFLDTYQSTPNPELKNDLLFALTTAKSHTKDLIALLKNPEIIKPQDHLYLYVYLLKNPHAKEQTLTWLFNNWSYLEQSTGEKSLEDYPRLTAHSIRDTKTFTAFTDFFRPHRDNPTLSRTLRIANSQIQALLELIEKDQSALHQRISQKTPTHSPIKESP